MLGDAETRCDIFVDEPFRKHSKHIGFTGGDLFRQSSLNLQRPIVVDGGQALCSGRAQKDQSIMSGNSDRASASL